MLPLTLLRGAVGNQMLVELKDGETFNGTLVNCDNWMNMNLKDVICTSPDGTKFLKMDECHIRGYTVKYLRIPEEIMDTISEDSRKRGGSAGPRLSRGRGRGRGGDREQGAGRGRGRGAPMDDRGGDRDQGGRGRGRGDRSSGPGTRGGVGGRGRGRGS